jgi:antitoxin MazE
MDVQADAVAGSQFEVETIERERASLLTFCLDIQLWIMEPLDPKKGDEIEISIAGKREFKIPRDRSKEKALEAIRRLARPLPPGFRFDREEANER